jgi:adenosine 3'-phospho 5'-phosphosulfate transporter B2
MIQRHLLAEGQRRSDDKDPPPIGLVSLVTLGGAIAVLAFYYIGVHMVGPGQEESKENSRHTIDLTSCFFLIIVFFCSYGVAQEYIMTEDYGGELFPNTTFLIFCNRIVICCFSTSALLAAKEHIKLDVAKWTVIPAATVLTSSWAQYECLHYVTFPTQVVFKSGKIVPTMLINTVVNRVRAPWTDYLLALVITGAVAGFSLVAEEAKGADQSSFYGIMLLCLFLICDALTSNTEKWVYNKDKEFSNRQMMFSIGFVTLIYSGICTACAPGGFNLVFGFIGRHPECIPQIVMLACNSTLGQYVIYYTVRTHGPVHLAVMMTVRQIISVYISAVLYHHDIPLLAGMFAAMAFGAVLSKPLYKAFASGSVDGAQKGEEKGKH